MSEAAALPGGTADVSRRRLSMTLAFEWLCRVVGVALGVAVMALLTRYLGPRRFGDLSLALSLTGIAHYTADVGFKQAAIRHASIEPEGRDQLAGTFVVIRGALASVFYAVVCLIGVIVAHDRESALVVVIVGAILPLAFFSSAGFLLHVRLRNELFAVNLLTQSVLWLAVVVAATVWHWSLAAIALGYLVTFVIQAAAVFFMARLLVPFSFALDRQVGRRLLSVALPLTAAGLFMALALRLDSILVYDINGAGDAGFYTSAYRILEQLQIVPAAIVALLGPLLARWLTTDPARFRRLVELFVKYLLLVAVPTTFGLCVLSHRLAILLFGPEFAPAGDYLAVLALAFLGTAISALLFGALVAVGSARRLAITQLIILIGIVVADLALLPQYGPMAAAVVTVVAEIALAAVFYLHLLRLGLLGLPTVGSLRLLVPTIGMLAVGLALLSISPLFAALGGSAIFCLLAFGTRTITVRELRRLLSRDVIATV